MMHRGRVALSANGDWQKAARPRSPYVQPATFRTFEGKRPNATLRTIPTCGAGLPGSNLSRVERYHRSATAFSQRHATRCQHSHAWRQLVSVARQCCVASAKKFVYGRRKRVNVSEAVAKR